MKKRTAVHMKWDTGEKRGQWVRGKLPKLSGSFRRGGKPWGGSQGWTRLDHRGEDR